MLVSLCTQGGLTCTAVTPMSKGELEDDGTVLEVLSSLSASTNGGTSLEGVDTIAKLSIVQVDHVSK